MKPAQYHDLLLALDRALAVLENAHTDLSADDHQLQLRLSTLRSQVLRAESGHPFPFGAPAADDEALLDPQLTPAPWSKIVIRESDRVPPGLSPL